ncbi:MAG: sigma-54-dependent Fis family transcriptional regulator, partial [Planctomycetales bacterium]|nr:sigma-54-dependent Fis family transcriptional regulator [Planctomycetales bacterium]
MPNSKQLDKHIDLLLVDDDDEYRETIVRWFERRGFSVHAAGSAAQALEFADRRAFDVAVFDLMMPEMSGLELLERFKPMQPECEVIMLTGKGTIESAVQAMKLGAYDFLTKPFPLAELERLIEKAHERRSLKQENLQLKTLLKRREPASTIIGESAAMREVFRLIQRAGPSEKAILIQGESGTGKELVARALHQNSPRSDRPLVVVNCAALPETLLESELFGHEKGAFTGAVNAKPGLFEIAHGGTLFIDEIGELPGPLQAKLLRVLEDGSLRRIGSLKEHRVDVRLLAATNRNLAQEVQQGRFREDLYYRINVMSLELPPLRIRTGDVELLLDHFLGPDWEIEPDAEQLLLRYPWPGNVRQLINAVERAKIMAEENT